MKQKSKIFILIFVLFVFSIGLYAAVPAITDTDIEVTATNTGTNETTAIVETMITVTLTDPNHGDADAIISATADLTDFGATNIIDLTHNGNGQWTGQFTLTNGTIDDTGVCASVTATNGDGTTGPVADDLLFTVDNQIPAATDWGTLSLAQNNDDVPNAVADLSNGDPDVVRYTKGTTQVNDGDIWEIATPEFDDNFVVTNGDNFDEATLVEGSLDNILWNPTIVLHDNAGNSAQSSISSAFYVDNVIPTMDATDQDLSNTGYLRFSPSSAPVGGLDDTPDELKLSLDFENWGTTGNVAGFTLRVDEESNNIRSQLGFVTIGFADVTEESDGTLSFNWDGKVNGNYVTQTTGVYGLTLWSICDAAGNTLVLEHNLTDDTDLSNGAMINRIHSVIDNIAPVFYDYDNDNDYLELTSNTINRYFIDANNNGVADSGENTTFVGETSFSFGVERDFTVNSDLLRHELVKYWVVVEENADPTNIHYFYEGCNTAGEDTVTKPEIFEEDSYATTALLGVDENSKMTLDLGFDETFAEYPEGTYTVYAYIQDNAGNIAASAKQFNIVDHLAPAGESIEITSIHSDPNGLDSLDVDGNPIFYKDREGIYVTSDEIVVKFTINPNTSISKMVIDATVLGLGEIEVLHGEFINNVHTETWFVSDLDDVPIGKYKIGDSAGDDFSIPVTLFDDSNDQNESDFVSTSIDFNLADPPVPPVLGDAFTLELSVDNESFSPGVPYWTYSSDVNPANDDSKDSSIISYSIVSSAGEACIYTMKIEKADNSHSIVISDEIAAGATIENTYEFFGYDDDENFTLFGEGDVNVTLSVAPIEYADGGYTYENLEADPLVLNIDNTNPEFLDVQYDGFIYNNNIIASEYDPIFEFSIETTEEISTEGWEILVTDETGEPISFGAGDVLAIIDSIVTTDNLNFDVYGHITGFTADEYEGEPIKDAILVIRAANDAAGNPGRRNNPAYPLGADAFFADATEAFMDIELFNAKPSIESLEFTTWNSTTVEDFLNDANDIDGFVNDNGTFELNANIGNADYVLSNIDVITADLSVFGLSETEDISNSPFNIVDTDFENGDSITIPVTISSTKYGKLLWSITKEISITADLENPIISDPEITNVTSVRTPDFISGIYRFTYTITDQNSGVKWDTATLQFNPSANIQINTPVHEDGTDLIYWDVTTSPLNNSFIDDLKAVVTVYDYVNNYETNETTWSMGDVPEISNVIIHGEVDDIYFASGSDLTVDFNLTNPDQVDYLLVELTGANGTYSWDNNNGTETSHVFEDVIADDAAEITATVTGYITTETGNVELVFGAGNNVDTIIADTKPVIDEIKFFNPDSTEVDFFSENVLETLVTQNDKPFAQVRVVAVDNNMDNDVTIDHANFTFGNVQLIDYQNDGIFVYRFYIEDYIRNTEPTGHYLAEIEANAISMYEYAADMQTRQLVILQDGFDTMFGVTNADRYSGADPEGWFAPEHQINSEFIVWSDTTVESNSLNLLGDFDNITDSVPDEIIPPTSTSYSDINIEFNNLGVTSIVSLRKHEALWLVDPDVQSIWNAYSDGESIGITFSYDDPFTNLNIVDNASIKVDLEVPSYEGVYYVAHEDATFDATINDPTFEAINSMNSIDTDLPLTFNEVTQQDEFVGKIYVKVPANDTPGVGMGEFDDIDTIENWTVNFIKYEEVGNTKSAIWEFIPTVDLTNGDQLIIQLPRIEDLVGHYNYGGEGYDSTSQNYEADAPVITINFVSDFSELAELSIFQWNNEDSAPYIRSGNEVGLKLKLQQVNQSRASVVTDISIQSVEVFTDSLENDSDDSWVALQYDNIEDEYYLANSIIAGDYVDGSALQIKYRVVYLYTYSDNSTNTETYTSNWITSYEAIIDNAAPVFETDGIRIWSESLTEAQEGYVVPGDTDANIEVRFTDEIAFDNDSVTPNVTINGLDNVVVTPLPAPVFTLNNDIWTALYSGVEIKSAVANDSYVFDVTVTDVLGNSATADRMVEVTGNQGLMPLIKAIHVNSVNAHANVPEYNIAEEHSIEINVEVQADVINYIEELWLDLSNIGGPAHQTVSDISGNSPDFVGTFILDNPTGVGTETIIAHTYRQPYGTTNVFTDEFEVDVHFDTNDMEWSNQAFAQNNVEWTFNPDADGIEISAVFTDIYGDHPEWHVNSLDSIKDWFILSNTVGGNMFLNADEEAFSVVRDISDAGHTVADTVLVTWHIDSNELHPDFFDEDLSDPQNPIWSAFENTENQTLNFNFISRNIYGEVFSNESNAVLIDDKAPVFTEAYTYGNGHNGNHTIVIGQDANVNMHLVYDDVSEVASMQANWGEFGGNIITPNATRNVAEFSMNLNSLGFNPTQSVTNNLKIILVDRLGNSTDDGFYTFGGVDVNQYIPTTFIVEENSTYDVAINDSNTFEQFSGNWYTKDADLEMVANHTIMSLDTIDNDNDGNVDEVGEGLNFDTREVWINRHTDNNWYPFNSIVANDNHVSLDGDYANFTEGEYNVKLAMENIFGQDLEKTVQFYVDKTAPVVTGIQFGNEQYTIGSVINSYSDWTTIKVHLSDPDILGTGINGSGVDYQNDLYPETAPNFSTVRLLDANDVVIAEMAQDAYLANSDYVQLSATGNWDAASLVAGNYKLEINVVDKIGNTDQYIKEFYYNHTQATFTVDIYNGTTQITDGNIDISSENVFVHVNNLVDVGTVDHVEFTLYKEGTEIDHIVTDIDNSVPFETTWDMLSAGITDYMNIYNANDMPANREWTLETKVVSNSGAESISNTTLQVFDDIGPKPTIFDYNGAGNQVAYTVDYADMFAQIDTNNDDEISLAEFTAIDVTAFDWLFTQFGDLAVEYDLIDVDANDIVDDVEFANIVFDLSNYRSVLYDYNNPTNNHNEIYAYCHYNDDGVTELSDIYENIDNNDPNWPDAWKVDFNIYNASGALVETIPNTYMEVGTDNYIADWDWTNYALNNPGVYKIEAVGTDRVNNEATSEFWVVEVKSTGNAWAELSMWNISYPNGGNENAQIADNTIYSPNSPIEDLDELRLDVIVHSADEIQSLGFFYERTNMNTGVTGAKTAVINDVVINPDMDADASNITASQLVNGSCSIVVDSSIYETDYIGNDYQYRFFVEMIDFTGAEFLLPLHASDREQEIRIDYAAPTTAALCDAAALPLQGIVNDIQLEIDANTNPIDEINAAAYTMAFKWRRVGEVDWRDLDVANVVNFTIDNNPLNTLYNCNNWNTGIIEVSDNVLEGNVETAIEVTDARGNTAMSSPVTVYLDNQAPIAPANILTYVPVDAVQTTINVVPADTYTVRNNTLLSIKVYRDQITHLGTAYPADGQVDDLAMPIKLFDVDTGQIVAYDHELETDANGDYYEFEYVFNIPMNTTEVRNFAVVAHDIRNNEEDMTIDLQLEIVDETIVTNIEGYVEGAENSDNIAVGGIMNIPVTMAGDTDHIALVQYSINNDEAWTDVVAVPYTDDVSVDFKLSNDDPMLNWAMGAAPINTVPGIHIVNTDTDSEILELVLTGNDWNGTKVFNLPAAATMQTINYTYVIDANNDGVVVGDEYGNPDYMFKPENLILTHYFYQYDTTGMNGYYTFRATNVDADENDVLNEKLIPIDNNAIAMTPGIGIQGYENNWIAEGEQLTLFNNIDNIGAVDGAVDVYYQYLAHNNNGDFWVNVGTSNDIGADYAVNFIAPDPENDGNDNDLDGVIDEADEANTMYYFRGFAVDAAGNMSVYSNTTINVDASEAKMLINTVAGTQIVDPNAETIINIPLNGMLEITAIDVTEQIFDGAVTATYEWSRLENNGWSNWNPINLVPVPATESVTWTLADIENAEDSYQLKVTAFDRFGQSTATTAAIMLNDENMPSATITAIGGAVIVGDYAFINSANITNPAVITANYPDADNIATLRFDYSVDNTNWIYLGTHDFTRGSVNQNWTIPNTDAGNHYYVRVIAEDLYGNDSVQQVMEYYIDNEAPGIPTVTLDSHYNQALNALVINPTETLEMTIENIVAASEHSFGDIKTINISFGNQVMNVVNLDAVAVDSVPVEKDFDQALWNNLYDGRHDFTIQAIDFAGNTSIITNVLDEVIFDTTAPIVQNFAPVNGAWENVYNQTSSFVFDYTDGTGVGVNVTAAFAAYFTYNNVVDTVQTYVLDDVAGTITFDWTPSAEMQEFIVNNGDEINVDVSLDLSDKLGQLTQFDVPNDYTLHYGIPALTRVMLVEDNVSNVATRHYINWDNNNLGEFVNANEMVGGNEITLYSYVPHLGEIPTSISYKYLAPGLDETIEANWEDCVVNTTQQNWNFIDPQFIANNQSQYTSVWDTSLLTERGDYKVKLISHYNSFESESIIQFEIYNGLIYPEITAISNIQNADAEYILERGETYTLETAFSNDEAVVDFVKYKYRYVSHNGADYIPVSDWMSFGDINGVEQNTWIDVNDDTVYPYEITIYPYYMINYKVQIIGLVKDIYGREMTIEEFIGNSGTPAYAELQDTVGPVAEITTDVVGEWASANLANGIVQITAALTDPSGVDHAELYFNNVLIDSELPLVENVDVTDLVSGTYEIRAEAWDTYNNYSTTTYSVNVDNDIPIISDIELFTTATRDINEAAVIDSISATITDAQSLVDPTTIILDGLNANNIVADSYENGVATWIFNPAIVLPNDVPFITYAVNANDNVGLTAVEYTEDFDIDVAPTIASVVVENTNNDTYMKDSDNLKVTVGLTDWERIAEMTITIDSDPVQTIQVVNIAETVEHTFNNVIATEGNANITATVEITTNYTTPITVSEIGIIAVDNDLPTANMVVTEGVLERESTVILNSNAADALSGVETVTFAYRMAVAEGQPANVWIDITDPALVDPFTTQEWQVPADLEFGAYYEFQAVVTDSVGLAFESISPTYEVTDSDTDITIASVEGELPPVVGPNGEYYPIATRLHGVIDLVSNVNEPNVPKLKYWIKENTAGANWVELGVSEDNANNYAFSFDTTDETLALADGVDYQDYFIGVAPNERNAAEIRDMVLVRIDNRMDINITTTLDTAINSEMEVIFSVLSDDEIDMNSATLGYAITINPEDWMFVPVTVERISQTQYAATADITGLNGYYNFKLVVNDMASTPNVVEHAFATDIMVDTTVPEVNIAEVNGETDLTDLSVELGNPINIVATAFDVLGGQEAQIASGIEKVEFYYNGNLISEDTTEPYEATLSTVGFTLGNYELQAKVYDNVGNEGIPSIVDIEIVTPSNLQPYAVISGFRFDEENCNEDYVYAVAEQWCNEIIESIRFEYTTDGVEWNEFGFADNNNDPYYEVQFNAEVMSNVIKIRTVAVINGEDSDIMPELAVTYSTEMGGSFVPTSTMMPTIYNDNKLVIENATDMPYITQLLDNAYIADLAVEMNGDIYETDINVVGAGEYQYWISSWNMVDDVQMTSIDFEVYANNAEMSGIAVESNLNIFFPQIYAEEEALMNNYLADDDYTALAPIFAVNSIPQGVGTITLDVADNIDLSAGAMYAAVWNGDEWAYSTTFDYDDTANTVTFDNALNAVYTVVQFGTPTVFVQFDSIDPSYMVDTAEWTIDNTEVSFFVYDEIIENGGYQSPNNVDFQMFVDDLEVAANYANGFVTCNLIDLEAGEHNVEVLVTVDGYTATAEHTFYVDITAPVITATGSQLNETNLDIVSNIFDMETGLESVNLFIAPVGNGTTPVDIDFDVNNTDFVYTLSINDIYGLIGTNTDIAELTAVWTAENNLGMQEFENVYYTVNLTGPTINFMADADAGWWLNPINTPNINFEVSVAEGTTIPNDGVTVDIYEVRFDGIEIALQEDMTIAGTENGLVYTYTVGFGQMLSPNAAGVRLEVSAENNYGSISTSQQTYSIDYAPPTMWALSPVGDPIDNDNDGLFNEDPIDGVNQDQDWEDWNNNGIWDVDGWVDINNNNVWDFVDYNNNGVHDPGEPMEPITIGEPGIVDEDVRDFYADELQYGTEVSIALAYEDVVGQIEYDDVWYYTGTSGIQEDALVVTLNGEIINGTVTESMFSYAAGVLDPGHYVIAASIEDNVGNAGSMTYEFDIIGGAPEVVFTDTNFWVSSNANAVLGFNVITDEGSELAEGGVVASIYTVPANELVQGPMTLSSDDDSYVVNFNSGVVPEDQVGIRLEVETTNIWGNTSTSSQTYGIDNNAPVITFISPENGAEFNIGEVVSVVASFSDNGAAVVKGTRSSVISKNSNRTVGSGIMSAELQISDPTGENTIVTTEEDVQSINSIVSNLQYGTYTVTLTVTDKVGNQAIEMLSFAVLAPAPSVRIIGISTQDDMYSYGDVYNPGNAITFNAEVEEVANVDISNIQLNIYRTYLDENEVIEQLIQEDASFSETINGVVHSIVYSSIPTNLAGDIGLRYELSATDVFGSMKTVSHSYTLDNTEPVISIISPEEGLEFEAGSGSTANVVIKANFEDLISGIDISSLMLEIDGLVIPNDDSALSVSGNQISYIGDFASGNHTIEISVKDNVSNIGSIAWVFVVDEVMEDAVLESAHFYPNPMKSGNSGTLALVWENDGNRGIKTASVSVSIYDFSGKLVRELQGTSDDVITWDGKTDSGTKLSRGIYFAKVVVNNGYQDYKKVVKIAIQ